MKKILFIFLFIFYTIIVNGQDIQKSSYVIKGDYFVPNIEKTSFSNINKIPDRSFISNGWISNGQTCAGCASYYWQILKSDDKLLAEDGNYYYYYFFYFFSNSFYPDGSNASTYLIKLDILINKNIIQTVDYILLPKKTPIWVTWIRYPDDITQYINFTVSKITVY